MKRYLTLIGCILTILVSVFAANIALAEEDITAYLEKADESILCENEGNVQSCIFTSDRKIRNKNIRYLGGNIYAADSIDEIAKAVDAEDIGYIEPSQKLTLAEYSSSPDDKYYYSQDNLKALKVPAAWSLGLYGSSSVTVAVIDSGIAFNHPDIDYSQVCKGKSYVRGISTVADAVGHGTFVSGIIMAKQNNGEGLAGISPGVKLMPMRIFDARSKASDEGAIAAIIDAADAGADVINMSFGKTEGTKALKEACEYAVKKGCILVAAAGNDGTFENQYPAAYDCVIGVGSTDCNGKVSKFSERGEGVYVTAPGEGISGLTRFGSYIIGSGEGTSFSCPEVSALAAMAKAADKSIAQEDFKLLLRQTSDSDTSGKDKNYGYGRVNFETAGKVIAGFRDALDEAEITLSAVKIPYDGKAKKPKVTVKYEGRALRSGDDYTVVYSDNKEIGKGCVSITGRGRYSGTVKKYFEIYDSEIKVDAELSQDGIYSLSEKTETYLNSILQKGDTAVICAPELNIRTDSSFLKKIAANTGVSLRSDAGYIYLDRTALAKLLKTESESIIFSLKDGRLAVTDGNMNNLLKDIELSVGLVTSEKDILAVRNGYIYSGNMKDGYFVFKTTKEGAYSLMKRKDAAKMKTAGMKVKFHTVKTGNNIKVVVDNNVSQLKKTGYSIRYKYYKSKNKESEYFLKKTSSLKKYVFKNAKGKKYRFKVRICIYDGKRLIAATAKP